MWKFPDYYSQQKNTPGLVVIAQCTRYLKLIYNLILKPRIESSLTVIKSNLNSGLIKVMPLIVILKREIYSKIYSKIIVKLPKRLEVFMETYKPYFRYFYNLLFDRPFSPSNVLWLYMVSNAIFIWPAIIQSQSFYLLTFYPPVATLFVIFLSSQMILSDHSKQWPVKKSLIIFFKIIEKLTPIFYTINNWWRWGASKTSYVEPNIRNTLYLNKFLHAPLLETVWTIIPGIILIFIAIPSFALLYALDESFDAGQTIKVIGKQWYWRYEYIDSFYKTRAYDSYMTSTKELSLGAPRLLMLTIPYFYVPMITLGL